MVAALVVTLAGLSLDGGCSGIFPGVGFVNLTSISIEMFATAWHLQPSPRLELYGSFDVFLRMTIGADVLPDTIFQLIF
jgi:hypothetical protein